MLSDAIRRRLQQLNRSPLDAQLASAEADRVAEMPAKRPADAGRQLALFQPPDDFFAAAANGTLEYRNAAGAHLRLRRPLSALAPGLAAQAPHQRQPPPAAAPAVVAHPELAALAEHDPQGALFLDLETCGFAGSMIFLIGLVWQVDGQLWLDQLLARNYAEERAVLATLWQVAADARVLVTFNGKSFDWPMVSDRSTLHRLERTACVAGPRSAGPSSPGNAAPGSPALGTLVHCDLLHHARRRWRTRLPDCRLQTLERWVCRRHRSGDIPGALVPAVYHDYVRRGNLAIIEPVLHHNALDLLTLVQLGQAILAPATAAAESA